MPAEKNRFIGIDVDAVLLDSHSAMRKYVWEKYGKTWYEGDPRSWLFLTEDSILTGEEAKAIFLDPAYFNLTEPLPDAKHALDLLKRFNLQPFLVTARGATEPYDSPARWGILEETLKMLSKHDLFWRGITISDDKACIAEKYNIRYFIEDNLETVLELSKVCKYVFLVDYLYNQTDQEIPDNIIRVPSVLDAVYDILCDLGLV